MDIQGERNMEEEKHMVKRSLNFLLGLLFFITNLSELQGELTSQKKLLFFFDKIEVRGNVDVFLTKGKRLREATLYADSEIITSIKTRVSKKTLHIDANNTYNLARRLPFLKIKAQRKYPVEIVVSIESMKEIRLLEQSNLTAENLNSDTLSIFMGSEGKLHIENLSVKNLNIIHEGTGDIVLKGKEIEEIKAKVSESGSIFADELEVTRATLIHHGSGAVHLKPSQWLDARMHRNGNLFLHAKPNNLVIDQQGTGKVSDILPDAPTFYDFNKTEK